MSFAAAPRVPIASGQLGRVVRDGSMSHAGYWLEQCQAAAVSLPSGTSNCLSNCIAMLAEQEGVEVVVEVAALFKTMQVEDAARDSGMEMPNGKRLVAWLASLDPQQPDEALQLATALGAAFAHGAG
eukprot:EG_transcript_46646